MVVQENCVRLVRPAQVVNDERNDGKYTATEPGQCVQAIQQVHHGTVLIGFKPELNRLDLIHIHWVFGFRLEAVGSIMFVTILRFTQGFFFHPAGAFAAF